MKIYFAGNPGHGKAGLAREKILKEEAGNVMLSYFWCREGGDFNKFFRRMVDECDKGSKETES